MEETNEFMKLLEDINVNFKENINDIPRELKDGIMKLSYSESKKVKDIDEKHLTSLLYRAYIMGMMFEKEIKKQNRYTRKKSDKKIIKLFAN